MRTFTTSTIGLSHLNHNEDAFLSTYITNDIILLATMDGCSMGNESHFASTLVKKILDTIARSINHRSFITKEEKTLLGYQEEILHRLFLSLKEIKNTLLLSFEDLLTTLSICIINKKSSELESITIGDGLIYIDGISFDFDQNNKPDYIGYHLDENFTEWYSKQTQRINKKSFNNLCLATDGIFSFTKFDYKNDESLSNEEIVQLLLEDKNGVENEFMLRNKVNLIHDYFNMKPMDDLTVIRVIRDLSHTKK